MSTPWVLRDTAGRTHLIDDYQQARQLLECGAVEVDLSGIYITTPLTSGIDDGDSVRELKARAAANLQLLSHAEAVDELQAGRVRPASRDELAILESALARAKLAPCGTFIRTPATEPR